MLPPAVGDHWTYELRDIISGDLKGNSTQTITDMTNDEISVQAHALGAPTSAYLVYDHLWGLKSNQIWKYAPSDGTGIRDSMKVGQTWDIKTADSNNSRTMWRRQVTSKVTGEEAITTQAGTFSALKIETTVHARGVVDAAKKWDEFITTWYVPSVNHWVKRTDKMVSDGHVRTNNTVELVEFGRQ